MLSLDHSLHIELLHLIHVHFDLWHITISNYIDALCERIGIDFADKNTTFANCNKIIQNELYIDLMLSLDHSLHIELLHLIHVHFDLWHF